MEIWATGITVAQRLGQRFKLLDHRKDSLSFQVNPTIQPFTNVDSALRTKLLIATAKAVSAVGSYEIAESIVPVNKRFYLKQIYLTLSTGTYTFINVYIYDGVTRIPLVQAALQTFFLVKEPTERRMDMGQQIGFQIDSYVGPGDAVIYIEVESEDIGNL